MHRPFLTPHRLKILALGLLTAFIVILRLRTYHEPFMGDITTYAVMAREMHYGKKLYSELIDHKPPAIFVAFQAAQCLAGYGPFSIFLLSVATAVLTLFGIGFAVETLTTNVIAGLVAACFWALTCGDLLLEGNQPNVEAFLNALLVWGIFFYFSKTAHRRLALWTAAMLFALATLFWQPVAMIVIMLFLGHAAALGGGIQSLKKRIQEGAIFLGVSVATWGVVVLYYAFTGRLKAFFQLLFQFQIYYGQLGKPWFARVVESFHPPIVPTELGGHALAYFFPFLLVPLAGGLIALRNKQGRPWLFLAFYALGVHLTILLAGKYFSHSYLLWLPMLALAWGYACHAFSTQARLSMRMAGYALTVLSGLFIGVREVGYLRFSAEEWSIKKYGFEYALTRKTGERLDQLLDSHDTFFNWGMQTGLYYWSGRRPPIGAFYNYFLLAGPQARALTFRSLTELEASPPSLVIGFHNTYEYADWYYNHPVARWIAAHYRPFEWETQRSTFRFFVRRGSPLEKRIGQGQWHCHFLDKANDAEK